MASQLDKKTKLLISLAIGDAIAMYLIGFHRALDVRYFYDGTDASLLLSLLSRAERTAYLRTNILDFLFIFLYSFLAFHLLDKIFGKSKLRFLGLVPGVFDLIETVSIFFMLLFGAPENLDWLGYVTCAKWTSGALLIVWWITLLLRRRVSNIAR